MNVRGRFGYTKPSPAAIKKMASLRKRFADLAQELLRECHWECPERTRALGRLEEAAMWANKAVCRNDEDGILEIP